jgi:hypothetical protein
MAEGGSGGSGGGPGQETAGEANREGSEIEGSGGRPCPACGEPMYSRHCKYVCPQHGVVFDCADTFY